MGNLYIFSSAHLDSASTRLRFENHVSLFFFFLVPAALFDQVNREQCTGALFMSPTVLFIHLKIISLQYFQFQQK